MRWIVGNQGMLGKELSHLFDTLGVPYWGTDREVDITNPEALASQHQPFDWILNCAAYTAVDKAEDEEELCSKLNAEGPANLANLAQTRGGKILHISTDYVFDGEQTAPYQEGHPPNPKGVYGRTKQAGEQGVLSRPHQGYIIRTSWLYGQYGNNFVKTMLRLMQERDAVSVVHDQQGSPTWAQDLARAIHTLTQRVDEGAGVPPGIYHYANEGAITWYDFAAEIYKLGKERGILSRNCVVRPCTTAEYPTKAARPAYSVLDTSKIKAALKIQIPHWKTSLKEYIWASKA